MLAVALERSVDVYCDVPVVGPGAHELLRALPGGVVEILGMESRGSVICLLGKRAHSIRPVPMQSTRIVLLNQVAARVISMGIPVGPNLDGVQLIETRAKQ